MNSPKITGVAALGLKDPHLFRQQCYIDGKWSDADSGKTVTDSNPASSSKITMLDRVNHCISPILAAHSHARHKPTHSDSARNSSAFITSSSVAGGA